MVEVDAGARSFTDGTLCRVGRAWRARAAAGGRLAPGRAVRERGMNRVGVQHFFLS